MAGILACRWKNGMPAREVREHLAEELLITAGLPVGLIARRLGHVEVSSPSQAFRRWKGADPREYRSEYRRQRPAPVRAHWARHDASLALSQAW